MLKYIDETIVVPSPSVLERVDCCGTSRSLYCPECYKCLVPSDFWPFGVDSRQRQDHFTLVESLQTLPFSMDIILGRKERRTSSTGVHIMVLRRLMKEMMTTKMGAVNGDKECGNNDDSDCDASMSPSRWWWWCWENTRLIDMNRMDETTTSAADSQDK